VPIVGKEQVLRGREMHWLRIDRYFRGERRRPGPRVTHQVITCHHVENAAVRAGLSRGRDRAQHEGLSDMV